MRRKLTLSLSDGLYEQFKAIQETLGHEEPEETMRVLINLGVLAVTLTTKDQPMLELLNKNDRTRRGGYDFGKGTAC